MSKYLPCIVFCLAFTSLAQADPSALPAPVISRLRHSVQQQLPAGLFLSGDGQSYAYTGPHTYSADLGVEPSHGIEITGDASEYSIRFVPLIPGLMRAQRSDRQILYSSEDGSTRFRYEFKRNG